MISVICATFGDREIWDPLAERAIGSLDAQTTRPRDIIRSHGETLAAARNHGASLATGEFLLFIDADDCVDQHYIEAMTEAISLSSRRRVLLQPATRGWYADGSMDDEAILIPAKASLRQGNWMVIGTVVERSLFLEAGGFWEEPSAEDWSLWLRCRALGAGLVTVPGAVYLVRQNPTSRNQAPIGGTFTQILSTFDEWLTVTPHAQSEV